KPDSSQEFVTVIKGICADRTSLDPMIILKVEDFVVEWFKRLQGVLKNILFGKSYNGWTDERMVIKYLKRNFGPISQSAVKVGKEY
ncbi:hypothetical protein L873DRAFT_1721715, partial [Choiromyces venosus 120613-1]